MSEGSVDSELAALLDEEFFHEDDIPAPPAASPPQGAATEVPEQQQQNKRARLSSREASPAKLKDDPSFPQDEEEEENAGQQATGYVCPPHPGWWNDMCIRCGAVRPSSTNNQQAVLAARKPAPAVPTTKITHLHHRQALEVSAHEAARIASGSLQRLIAQKRLVLVLDLDHTLLNTVRDIDLAGPEREAAIKQLEQQHKALQQQQQVQHASNSMQEESQQQQQQQQAGAGLEASCGASDAAADAVDAAAGAAAAVDMGSGAVQDPGEQQQQGEAPDTAAAAAAGAGPGSSSGTANGNGSSNGNGDGSAWSSRPSEGPVSQLYYFRDKGLWTKLRPGVGAFLSAVSRLYELHIYTMGDKGYAALMADALDPQHKLFVGRVISAADSTRAGVKDLDVLLADESLVLILDDTEHVWEKHRANLIQVERYHFFSASARLFHPDAVSPLQQGSDEPQQGGMLDNAAQLLARIHARVYGTDAQPPQQQQQQHEEEQEPEGEEEEEQQEEGSSGSQQQQQRQQSAPGIRRVVKRRKVAEGQPAAAGSWGGAAGLPPHNDVRECLEAERHRVLAGCSIVFSRCWPQQQEPQSHPLWLLAERLGATCSLLLQPGVTSHLVVAPDTQQPPGNVPFTDKVQAAQKAGIPVVHPDWLLACRFAWKQLPAADFSLLTYSTVPGSSCCSRRWLGPVRSAAGAAAAAAAERSAVMKGAGRIGP